ncbi:MAG: thiamine biosynthesis lipoprotein ApbE [Methanomethylovorans sp. PtaU1.Bin093]|uniref:FAD:protein FMN transferase n=2 Tax=Methanomethylovorans TaxID=101191 RepID=UPI0009D40FF3|nr:FAD:protein FMN transferase [Methanomethylovorans sp. PtaU1.Bin093]OPY20669.1 MAG: thiamine biosynthesis lipoprotein ApbE [Methanomethylovorans sp. PtaU1.Bin093]
MMYKTVTIALIAVLSVSFVMNCIDKDTDSQEPLLQIYNDTRSIMDTIVTIKVVDTNSAHAREVIDNAFEKIYYVDSSMDYFDNTSELSRLNTNSQLLNASNDLTYVINKSIYYQHITRGAFDITVLPLLDLWKSKFAPGGTQQPPTEDELDATLRLVNASNITIEGNDIFLQKGMKITLGGIAKGYALDLAIDSLRKDGITSGFVDAGGNGYYIGYKPDGTSWRVGLQDPNMSQQVITVIEITDMAVATSGNYERYFSEEAKVSHIADPRTGYPSQNLISATVIAPLGIDSDALSTSVFVLGEQEGLEMIEELNGVECLLITNDKRIVKSSGFEKYEVASA